MDLYGPAAWFKQMDGQITVSVARSHMFVSAKSFYARNLTTYYRCSINGHILVIFTAL